MRADRRWPALLPGLWAAALAVLMLGAALGPGYVLAYDMVWVPDLAMTSDALGLGSALPRAVPSDAVVAVLDEVVPGLLLQKIVLVGALAGGGVGAARLCGTPSVAGRLTASGVYVWNPFVVERLSIGHWPVLVGYAVLPWLALAAIASRREGRLRPAVPVLLALGSLSAGAALVSVVTLLAFTARRGSLRTAAASGAWAVAASAPWLVAGLLHAAQARTDAVGARVFALHGFEGLPAPLVAVGLGGIWNSEVAAPRTPAMAAVAAVVVGLLVLAGLPGLRRALGRGDLLALAGCAALGYTAAVALAALPGATGWLVSTVPGAGLLRDGSRLLALCAPVVAAAAGHAVAGLTRRSPAGPPRVLLGVGLVLLPVALLPGAALGVSGRLAAVSYPQAYDDVRSQVSEAIAGAGGDVAVVPFESYRAPAWNGGRKVLDPLGRYLGTGFVANDELVVSGRLVAGEDPRAREVGEALTDPDPASRRAALADLGIGAVAQVEPEPRVEVLRGVAERPVPGWWRGAMTAAWAAYLMTVGIGVTGLTVGSARFLRSRADRRVSSE